ncbi:beta-lactamase-like protein [Aspergillus karnatakaensis]|uniref:MBL fold metallo-hydrolase n=1 Tax=Aspergillus karnatakaensis TaxID=1810916 RepID=UPI003CCE2924
MGSIEPGISPVPPPQLDIPESTSTVTLQALDTTLQLYVRAENFLNPVIPGHEAWNCPAMAFLITHPQMGRKVLFDAGARKDYWNYSPVTTDRFAKGVNVKGLKIDMGVHEVLTAAGIELDSLDAVIWSHWHFDHIGDMSQFPSKVNLIVGPGFKDNLLPGYPSNPVSPLLETDYSDREMREITFSNTLKIGQFRAHDLFDDGSFYLLDVPGHAIGHMCGLARTTPSTFVLLGADSCHFAGSLRPSPYTPLPDSITGLDPFYPSPCPCELLGTRHPSTAEPNEKRTQPYYTASAATKSVYIDPATANSSVRGLMEFDARPEVFICLAHDPSLFDVLPLLNHNPSADIGEWKEQGYKEATRWKFLNELPKDGQPGRPPLVEGFWRDGKRVDVSVAMKR